MKLNKKEYKKLVGERSRSSKLIKDVLCAFVFGGVICVIGQIAFNFYQKEFGLDVETARTAVSMTMVFLGALLTGTGVYGRLAKHAGAGTLVPITGFANAIVSPAMEFKKEGLILGLASKMFVIAGPVLVYGISASAAVGVIYWIINVFFGGSV